MKWKRGTTTCWRKLVCGGPQDAGNLLLGIVLLMGVGAAGASPQVSDSYPRLWADAGSRLGPDGKARLEVLAEYCHDGLHFEKTAEGYEARLELTLVAYDANGRQVGGDSWRRRVTVTSYAATLSDTSCERETLALVLPPGLYTAAVAAADRRSGEKSRLVFPVRVGGETDEGWHLSDILFLRPTESGNEEGGPRKLEGRPDIRRRYGDEASEIVAEVELYTQSSGEVFPPSDLQLTYRIEDWKGDQTAAGDAALVGSFPGSAKCPAWVRYLVRHPLAELGRGTYSLLVSCRGGGISGRGLSRRETFQVVSSAAFWERDYLHMVEILRYIASTEEVREMLDAPPEERRALWDAFWEARDPTPGTPRNETEEEYFRRVSFANNNFGTFHREGWETDRGMIYILLGPPDDIDRLSEAMGGRAQEVWYYYQESRRFYFVDDSGFGDFRLRGEIGP